MAQEAPRPAPVCLLLDGIRITNPHSSAIRKSCGRCIWRPVPLRPVITEKLADINYTGTDTEFAVLF